MGYMHVGAYWKLWSYLFSITIDFGKNIFLMSPRPKNGSFWRYYIFASFIKWKITCQPESDGRGGEISLFCIMARCVITFPRKKVGMFSTMFERDCLKLRADISRENDAERDYLLLCRLLSMRWSTITFWYGNCRGKNRCIGSFSAMNNPNTERSTDNIQDSERMAECEDHLSLREVIGEFWQVFGRT